MHTHIRIATIHDRDYIHDVHLEAFPQGEGRLIADLAVNLLSEECEPAPVNLVAETSGGVVGHIAFSPVYARPDKKWLGYILAPLAVKPKDHNIGIGSKLVESGIARLSELGVNLLLVYGDPKYYGRFGFAAQAASNFLPPYELTYPFGWLAILRRQGGDNKQAVQLSCVASLRNPALW